MSAKNFNSYDMFQWPEPASCTFDKRNPVYYKYKKKKIKPSLIKIKKIENFFQTKYKSKFALLLPSGRAAINSILRYHQIDRSKITNVPLWTSTCLLHAVTAITNVSVKNKNANCNIVVHKWGNTYKINKRNNKDQILIDDSADSFPANEFRPYENSSNFEILSLPKLIGSFSGGIILTNKDNFYKYIKKTQTKNLIYARNQSERKFISSFIDKSNLDWRFYESYNTSVDFNSVENIFKCLSNYKLNKDTILRRTKLFKKYFKNIMNDKKRIGPCLILNLNKYKKFKNYLEEKNFDFSKRANRENYKKCLIMPIHFGIPEKIFLKKLNQLLDIKKKGL